MLAAAGVGFAAPPALRSLGEAGAGKNAPAGNAQPQTAQQKQEQQVFGQLAKAWTDYLAGSLAGAREAAEKLTRSDRETVRKEAAYLLARCLWDSGSDESRAVARKTWDDLGKDKTESGIQRQQIAKAILLEAAGKPNQAIAALVAVARNGLEDISTVEAAIELSKLVEDPGKAPEAAKALATAETVARKLLNGKDPVAKALAKRYDELWKNSKRSALNPAARFILSLVKDLPGNIWIGTEDSGVFRYNPDAEPASQWTQFTTKDGLGDDNAYAIACDKQGRIWVGQQCHGVAVYDGRKWKNYDVLEGPIGERIFDIACCPTDGDVWMATSAGLTRYRVKEDSWCYYTRADGLPEDQANTIAFDRTGTIYVGTQCHGIATAKSAGDYKTWRTITAPDRFGPNGCSPVPLTAAGSGLPTNMINQIVVGNDGTVWATTTTGLAWSRDAGKSWRFVRGKDYSGKVKGIYGGAPKGWTTAPKEIAEQLLPEDYVTCLANDPSGAIWLGTRRAGFIAIDPATNKRVSGTVESLGLSDNYVSAILPMSDGRPFVGSYVGGLIRPKEPIKLRDSAWHRRPDAQRKANAQPPPLPSPAKPPTLAELNMMLRCLAAVPAEKSAPGRAAGLPLVAPLPDDWRTKGDWLGRYGRYWSCCAAILSPQDYVWGADWEKVQYSARIGPNQNGYDSIRFWIHWLYTANDNSLEMPPTYMHSRVLRGLTSWKTFRRQAEWDDHGEAYPMTKDGPDLYCTVKVPAGIWVLSLYDFNKDGHEKNNRIRDYRISIRQHADNVELHNIDDFDRQEELAKGRIRDFCGGVYKRYLVRGPASLTLQLRRNFSFNTILAGVFLDLPDECPAPHFTTVEEWKTLAAQRDKTARQYAAGATGGRATVPTLDNESEAAANIADCLELLQYVNPSWHAAGARPYYLALLRWYARQANAANSSSGARPAAPAPLFPAADPPSRTFLSATPQTAPPPKPPTLDDRTGALATRLATCCYRLALYARWEDLQRRLGLLPARDIEHCLRWDGATRSCQGMGFKIVSEYLSNRAGAAETKAQPQVFEESGTRPKSDATPGNEKDVGNTNKGEPR
jgi:hypothetical protein